MFTSAVRLSKAIFAFSMILASLWSACASEGVWGGLWLHNPGGPNFAYMGPECLLAAVGGGIGGLLVFTRALRKGRNGWDALFLGALVLFLTHVVAYDTYLAYGIVLLLFSLPLIILAGVWLVPGIVLKLSGVSSESRASPADQGTTAAVEMPLSYLVCLIAVDAVAASFIVTSLLPGFPMTALSYVNLAAAASAVVLFAVSSARYGYQSGVFWGLCAVAGANAASAFTAHALFGLLPQTLAWNLGAPVPQLVVGTVAFLVVTVPLLLASRRVVFAALRLRRARVRAE